MTVEVVIWLPVFVALLCLVADASTILGRKAEVLRIVQDANRATSVGRLRDTDATEQFILERITAMAPNALIETTIVAGIVRTVVQIPTSDLTATLPVEFFSDVMVSVSAEHLLEA